MKQLTPLEAIQSFCKQCCGYSLKNVHDCPSRKCPFHPLRFGSNFPVQMLDDCINKIYEYCIICVGSATEIVHCTDPKCRLYHLRLEAIKHHFPKTYSVYGQGELFTSDLNSDVNSKIL